MEALISVLRLKISSVELLDGEKVGKSLISLQFERRTMVGFVAQNHKHQPVFATFGAFDSEVVLDVGVIGKLLIQVLPLFAPNKMTMRYDIGPLCVIVVDSRGPLRGGPIPLLAWQPRDSKKTTVADLPRPDQSADGIFPICPHIPPDSTVESNCRDTPLTICRSLAFSLPQARPEYSGSL